MCRVADAERDRVGVLAGIFDGEILRIAADPGDIRGGRFGAKPALLQRGSEKSVNEGPPKITSNVFCLMIRPQRSQT